jgi:hypothetical protein
MIEVFWVPSSLWTKVGSIADDISRNILVEEMLAQNMSLRMMPFLPRPGRVKARNWLEVILQENPCIKKGPGSSP